MSKKSKPIGIGVYKIFSDAKLPEKMTIDSACFDVYSYLKKGMNIKFYNKYNEKENILINSDSIEIFPLDRVLITTGIKLKIPEGYSVRIHPKSGQAFSKGLTLANCEGVIDYSYPDQLYILVNNISAVPICINHLERISQIEIVPVIEPVYSEIYEDVVPTTDRIGGVGSTGVGVK